MRGYKEKGNINTPLELAIRNQIDRFSIAMGVIDRVPQLKVAGADAKERFRNEQVACRYYAYANGIRQTRDPSLEVAAVTVHERRGGCA